MTRKLIVIIGLAGLLTCGLVYGDTNLGKKITLTDSQKVSDILQDPQAFVGKNFRVEGYIVDGCKHNGTWIALAGDQKYQKISVWPKEKQFTFPLDHKGKYAVVEGTLYPVTLTAEQAKKWREHLKEEHESQTEEIEDGPATLYRIDPVAVIIRDAQ